MSQTAVIPAPDARVGPLHVDWGSVLAHWLDDLRLTAHSESTLRSYGWAGQKFGEWLDERQLNLGEVDRRCILEYREACLSVRQWSLPTVQQHLSAIKNLFDWLFDTLGLDHRNPVSRMPRVQPSAAFKRNVLTDAEVTQLIQACPQTVRGIRDRAILTLMAFTGLRSIEVRRALRGDVDMKGSHRVLWVQGKGRLTRDEYVVLPPLAWDALQTWLAIGHKHRDPARPLFYSLKRGSQLTARGFINTMTYAFDRAGIDDPTKTAHSLRHTAITKSDLGGADGVQIMWMARHRSFDTTTRYLHQARRLLDPAELHIHYAGLEGGAA